MKKVFVSIFAVFYLGLSCGFAFNTHFCMGKFSSADFSHTSEVCNKCGMKSKEGCCKTKFTFVKITDSQQFSNSNVNIASPLSLIITYPHYTLLHLPVESVELTFTDTSPPPVSGAFICILNCTFTI